MHIAIGIILRIIFSLPFMLLGYLFQGVGRLLFLIGTYICMFAVGITKRLPYHAHVKHWQAWGEEEVKPSPDGSRKA